MFDSIIDSPIALSLLCGLFAALVVSPGYMPNRTRMAMAAPMPGKFPIQSFARAAAVAFVVLINLASLFLAHRVPVGTDLIMAGVLMLLFLPAEQTEDA